MKKTIALLLACLLLVGMLPVGAFAQEQSASQALLELAESAAADSQEEILEEPVEEPTTQPTEEAPQEEEPAPSEGLTIHEGTPTEADFAKEAILRDQLLIQETLPEDQDLPFSVPEGVVLDLVDLNQPLGVGSHNYVEKEYNNTFEFANGIKHDYTVSGELDPYDLMDFFGFTLKEKSKVEIDAVAKYDSFVMGIWNSTGMVLARDNTGIVTNALYGYTLELELEPGTYYLGMADGNDGYNSYTFYIDIEVQHAHNYIRGKVTLPTCTEKGYTTYTCSCGHSYKGDYKDAKGHTEVAVQGKPATCKETGLTNGKRCLICKVVTVKQEIIPKTDHNYVNNTCTVCGELNPDIGLPAGVIRIAGQDRHETAFKVADELKTALGISKFSAIIVASGENFPDALSGSYLATVLKAPILLHRGDSSLTRNMDYIRDNLVSGGKVYILGGTSAVPAMMETLLEKNSVAYERLKGDDRFATNLAILKKATLTGSEILVSTAYNFADSLSASATGKPMLLVKDRLTNEQKAYLEAQKAQKGSLTFTIIGGSSAVNETVAAELGRYGSVSRLSGAAREETSVKVARKYFTNPSTALLAYSRNFPDGLCGGPLAYAMGAPLLLVNAGQEEAARIYVAGLTLTRGYVLGGVAAVSNATAWKVFNGNISQSKTYTVTFDTDGGSLVTAQQVQAGQNAKVPAEPTKTGYTFLSWYTDKNESDWNKDYQFSQPVNQNLTLYAKWISEADTDGEGLIDGLEAYYKTNAGKQDTDGDGLSDYMEVVVLGTDPLTPEADPNKDTDGDGISDLDELRQGTNPSDADTDGDQLDDARERTLGTDPKNYDTDGDGASDGTEVKLGTNPLVADKSFAVSAKSDAGDKVSASVDISLSGSQVESLDVSPVSNEMLFPDDMPGYLGSAYNFSVDGDFTSATIQFTFDAASLPAGAEPAIFYFNEQTQTLEELNTKITGNVASAEVSHFSTYVLVDRKIYYSAFSWEDVWETDGTYDSVEIVLVIDDSGSMTSNDKNYQRLSVAQTLVDKLPEGSKMGVVHFANNAKALTEKMTQDRAAVKALLTKTYFKSSGGTYMYKAIGSGFALFESTSKDVLRMMVVLSDGATSDTGKHTSTINTAKEKDVRIYTVGLGSSTSYFTRYLKPLAEETKGAFYLASNADQLTSIYEDINKKIDLEADTDKDGIPDYYEDNMIAFNGKKITMDKTKKDTDGDGLEDGQEVKVELIYNADKTKVYVKGKLTSYPHLPDSDNDSIFDYHDPDPMEFTITDRTLSWVSKLSYTNLSAYVGKTVGQVMDSGVSLTLDKEYAKILKDAVIVSANDSQKLNWKDFGDGGLGSVALKIVRPNKGTAVIYAIRGTEPGNDLIKDGVADAKLGFTWQCKQSKEAFSEYKKIATSHSTDYYVVGHSLGGRLTQDVLYKTYNANEGGLFKEKANIPTPVHSATFNGLGYNRAVYITLENDVLAEYKSKLTNYYYWLDLVGEGLGSSGVFKRAGTDVELLCKNITGGYYRDKEFDNWFNVRDCDYHGIEYFNSDYDLLYANSDAPSGKTLPGSKLSHSFSYWVS